MRPKAKRVSCPQPGCTGSMEPVRSYGGKLIGRRCGLCSHLVEGGGKVRTFRPLTTGGLTEEEVARRTVRAIDRRRSLSRRLNAFSEDARSVERHVRSECQSCFYLDARICGQAFTEFSCLVCSRRHSHPNTCVPLLCQGCAEAHQLCRRCAGDIDMREVRG